MAELKEAPTFAVSPVMLYLVLSGPFVHCRRKAAFTVWLELPAFGVHVMQLIPDRLPEPQCRLDAVAVELGVLLLTVKTHRLEET